MATKEMEEGAQHTSEFRDASRSERGLGLGLTLVKGCAVAHGGTVEIESEPEKGTTFTLRFPSDARPYQPRATVGGPAA